MKQKFIDTKTGKEVKIGDDITIMFKFFGELMSFKGKIDTDSIPVLLDAGIIKAVKVEEKKKAPKVETYIHPVHKVENRNVPVEIASYIYRIASKMGWSFDYTEEYLDDLLELNKAALFSVLLREVAIAIDEKYIDDISKSKEIYAVSVLNGQIKQVPRKSIKSFRTLAAFRSEEDAQVALYILNDLLKYMYKHEEKN